MKLPNKQTPKHKDWLSEEATLHLTLHAEEKSQTKRLSVLEESKESVEREI